MTAGCIRIGFVHIEEFDSEDRVTRILHAHEATDITSALEKHKKWDLVFNSSYGLYGPAKHAQVPGILEAYQIPTTFSDAATLMLCQDKWKTKIWNKIMLEHCNIPTPPFAIVRNEEMALDPAPGQKAIELSPHATALSSYPLFVKPNAEGDSKGVVPASKVSNQDELESAIRVLREKFPQQDILIETFLPGQEFSVGILGTGREARVIGLASYNFRPLNDQNSPRQIDFHLQGKDNLESGAVEQVVMHMDHPGVREVGEMGIRAWNVLGCRDGGRVDIRLDAESKPQVLEDSRREQQNLIQGSGLLPILIGAVVTILLSYILAWTIRASPLHHVPGPWLNRYFGVSIALADIRGRRGQQCLAWHQQYGPIARIAPNQVSIASLTAIHEIYSSTSRADKSAFFNNFVAFDSRSVFTTLSFPDHKRKRAVVSAFFQGSNIYGQPAIESFIRSHAFAILHQIEGSVQGEKPIEFYPLADWYAFDNITMLVFGSLHASAATKRPCEERGILRNLKRAQAWAPIRQRFPWLIRLVKIVTSVSGGDTARFDAERHLARWTYDRTLRTLHDHRCLVGFDCLVVYLARKLGLDLGPGSLQESHGNPAHESIQYIAAEALDNINAAEASVAATITYMIWYISTHPEWQQRLRTELLALSVKADGLPSFSDIDRAPILDACLKEVYRLKPASGGRAERVIPAGGCVGSNVYLPEKTVVVASIAAVHTDPSLFPDAFKFCPSRWLQKDEATRARLNASIMPFGYGARVCLGKVMANMEIKLLLAAILLRYEIAPAGAQTGIWMKQAAARDGVRSGLKGEFHFRHLPAQGRQVAKNEVM
ncbi:hypothetical protein CNMCM7927_006431 [Aspergillus lentulus]|nr:hypothetical protein CNMCM7927_006431 [Aspergillus lentulus]